MKAKCGNCGLGLGSHCWRCWVCYPSTTSNHETTCSYMPGQATPGQATKKWCWRMPDRGWR